MTDDSTQIIDPTTIYGRMCRVTMIDNKKQPKMMVLTIQRCCPQFTMDMEHVQILTYLNYHTI